MRSNIRVQAAPSGQLFLKINPNAYSQSAIRAAASPPKPSHIYSSAYREDKVRQRNADSEGSGAGLGLSISQWIANLHGGRVTLDESSERGSTFSVRLPSSRLV